MTVLVMGAGGRLGREFMDRLSSLDDLTGLNHVQCDVTDSLAVERAALELQPTVVINCAAMSRVDECEKDRDQAYRINVLGARNVAHAAYKVAAKVVHFSTDYVFDGTADRPYTEWDTPNPINWYGRTKLMSEEAVQRANPDSLVLRVANVYGAHGDNTVTAVVRSAQAGMPLTLAGRPDHEPYQCVGAGPADHASHPARGCRDLPCCRQRPDLAPRVRAVCRDDPWVWTSSWFPCMPPTSPAVCPVPFGRRLRTSTCASRVRT